MHAMYVVTDPDGLNDLGINLLNNLTQILNTKYVVVCINVFFMLESYILVV